MTNSTSLLACAVAFDATAATAAPATVEVDPGKGWKSFCFFEFSATGKE